MNHNQNTDVQFEDSRYHSFTPQPSRIIQWVMKYSGGLIQNEKQASIALLGFAATALVVSIIISMSSSSNQPTPGPVPADQFVP